MNNLLHVYLDNNNKILLFFFANSERKDSRVSGRPAAFTVTRSTLYCTVPSVEVRPRRKVIFFFSAFTLVTCFSQRLSYNIIVRLHL